MRTMDLIGGPLALSSAELRAILAFVPKKCSQQECSVWFKQAQQTLTISASDGQRRLDVVLTGAPKEAYEFGLEGSFLSQGAELLDAATVRLYLDIPAMLEDRDAGIAYTVDEDQETEHPRGGESLRKRGAYVGQLQLWEVPPPPVPTMVGARLRAKDVPILSRLALSVEGTSVELVMPSEPGGRIIVLVESDDVRWVASFPQDVEAKQAPLMDQSELGQVDTVSTAVTVSGSKRVRKVKP